MQDENKKKSIFRKSFTEIGQKFYGGYDTNKKKSIFRKENFLRKLDRNFMADIRRDIGMAKENWPPAIGGPLQQNAPNILFEMLIILSASKYTYNHSMSFLKILVVLLPA